MQKLQRHAGTGVFAPDGLILGLKVNADIPTDWSSFTTADGNFLKGTDSDAVVGTSVGRSSVSISSGSGGGHNNGPGAEVVMVGYYSHCNDNCGNTMASGSYVGDHSGHSVPITYRPASVGLKLIQATKKTTVPPGSIMFGLASNPFQAAYSLLNGATGRPLAAAASTGLISEVKSAGTTSSRSYSHGHWYGDVKQCLSITTTYTSYSSSGPSHTHSGGTPSITPNLLRAAVRAFEIIDGRKIEGLIGMWVDAGVPDGWQVVASLVGKYLIFSTSGTGSSSGNNTITVSGTTGGSSHSHSFGGSQYNQSSPLPHNGSVSHSHSYSGSPAYEPERFHVKFIQFVG
jgi:hypothetical protein